MKSSKYHDATDKEDNLITLHHLHQKMLDYVLGDDTAWEQLQTMSSHITKELQSTPYFLVELVKGILRYERKIPIREMKRIENCFRYIKNTIFPHLSLLEQQQWLLATDDRQASLLHSAIDCPRQPFAAAIFKSVKALCAEEKHLYHTILLSQTIEGYSGLSQAIQTKSLEVVTFFLRELDQVFAEDKAAYGRYLALTSNHQFTVLQDALKTGQFPLIKLIFNKVGEVLKEDRAMLEQLLARHNKDQFNLLHQAAYANKPVIMDFILQFYIHHLGRNVAFPLLSTLALERTVHGFLPFSKNNREVNEMLLSYRDPAIDPYPQKKLAAHLKEEDHRTQQLKRKNNDSFTDQYKKLKPSMAIKEKEDTKPSDISEMELHWAVESKQLEEMKKVFLPYTSQFPDTKHLLISHLVAKNSEGNTLLHTALRREDFHIIRFIFKQTAFFLGPNSSAYCDLLLHSNHKDFTLPHYAIMSGDPQIVNYVFHEMGKVVSPTSPLFKSCLLSRTSQGFNLLHEASLTNKLPIMQSVVDMIQTAFTKDNPEAVLNILSKAIAFGSYYPSSKNADIENMLTKFRNNSAHQGVAYSTLLEKTSSNSRSFYCSY